MVSRGPLRVLLVCGYMTVIDEKTKEVIPDKLCDAMCRSVAAVYEEYDRIMLIGGQHLTTVEEHLGETMRRRLIELGVPAEKLDIWTQVPATYGTMPTRDTAEEMVRVNQIVKSGFYPEGTVFVVGLVEGFGAQIPALMEKLGFSCSVREFSSHGEMKQGGIEELKKTAALAATDPFRLTHVPSMIKRASRTRVAASRDNLPLIPTPDEQKQGFLLP